MNIQDNYLKNKKNIFFSENKDIQSHREKLISIFENDRFDKKNKQNQLTFILNKGIGKSFIYNNIDIQDLTKFLDKEL